VELRSPAELYAEVHGDAPDLIAYFGQLRWRSAGTVGHHRLHLLENDTGPDDAVHSFDGVLAWTGPEVKASVHLPDQRIIDMAPTILRKMGLEVPGHMQGRPIDALL
ncbi:MAG TPA: hypothetical protein VJR06_07310, partial [Nitrososphaerales archaeon]|nr:hypothetical protein [Nitrososphaerales archaeon]